MMMAKLDLCVRLFGSLELAAGKQPGEEITGEEIVSRPNSPQARSLLAYLILHHDRPIPRDRLTGIFWPERSDARARRALSHALWQIRNALGPAASRLTTDEDTVCFTLCAGDWLDVAVFQDKIERADDLSSREVDLSKAVGIYRADFLEACYDDWALLERERLRELYLRALESLIILYKQKGKYAQALECAQQLAAADPLRESAHRELMQLYHLLDRHRAALTQYETLCRLLDEELSVEPAAATTALYHEIVAALEEAGSPHLPVAAPPPPLLRDLAHLPFVGRSEERAALLDRLQAAGQGRGGMALVEGNAGVGKTRLVAEIVADARWRGFQVGLGKADPLATSTPYQSLREALLPLLTPMRVNQLRHLIEPEWLRVLPPLFPPLDESPSAVSGEHTPASSLGSTLDTAEEQRRLMESLVHLLEGLAAVTPLLLVVEDLHWADEATLDTLLHLVTHLSQQRVLFILTYRIAEARQRKIVWKTLETLDLRQSLRRVQLSSFERSEAVALVQRAMDVGPEDAQATAFAARLREETGGNALFLVESLKSLLERGHLTSSPEGWRFPAKDLPLLTPASVQMLVGERVTRLSAHMRRVLEMVAVLGEDADFTALSHAVDMEPVGLLAALGELEQRGFLVEMEDRYRLEHDRIQEIVYQNVPPDRRRILHRRAGHSLERSYPERIESLARHFSLGEVWDKAVAYNRQAGRRAGDVYAGVEAAAYYHQALSAWQRLRPRELAVGIDLHRARGRICQDIGRFDQAEADFWAAYELAEDMEDRVARFQVQAQALTLLSSLKFQQGDFEGAAEVAQRALDLAQAAEHKLEIADGLFKKANAIRNLGHHRQAIELYERAADVFAELDDLSHLADCLNRMGYVFVFRGDYDQAESVMTRSLNLRRQLDDRVGVAYSLINLSGVYAYRGYFSQVLQFTREALEVAHAIGDPYGEDAALNIQGVALLELGKPDQAIPYLEQALEIARQIGDRSLEPSALAEMGWAYFHLGDLERAYALLEKARDQALVSVEKQELPAIYAYSCQVARSLGHGAEALAYARAGLQVAQELEEPWSVGLAWRVMGDIAAQSGHLEAAIEPRACFEESVRILRKIGAEAELARSLAAYGRYLAQSTSVDEDEASRGAAMLAEARVLFRRLEMAGDLARLDAESAERRTARQLTIRLAQIDAPIGRPLREDEYVTVDWTVFAPEDDVITDPVERRRYQVLRLLREAAEQSAAPTVADLAAVLDVSQRTIKRDLAALRAAGHDVQTRGSRG